MTSERSLSEIELFLSEMEKVTLLDLRKRLRLIAADGGGEAAATAQGQINLLEQCLQQAKRRLMTAQEFDNLLTKAEGKSMK